MRKIVTFLWLESGAEEAVDLYKSLFDDLKVLYTSRYTESTAEMAGMKAVRQRLQK